MLTACYKWKCSECERTETQAWDIPIYESLAPMFRVPRPHPPRGWRVTFGKVFCPTHKPKFPVVMSDSALKAA